MHVVILQQNLQIAGDDRRLSWHRGGMSAETPEI